MSPCLNVPQRHRLEAGGDEVITDDELHAPISAQEADETICSLKPRKAAGVDGILNDDLSRLR